MRNRLYSDSPFGPEYKQGESLPRYAMRNVRSDSELSDIRASGIVRPLGNRAKYWTGTNAELPPIGNRQSTVIRCNISDWKWDSPVPLAALSIWDDAAKNWATLA